MQLEHFHDLSVNYFVNYYRLTKEIPYVIMLSPVDDKVIVTTQSIDSVKDRNFVLLSNSLLLFMKESTIYTIAFESLMKTSRKEDFEKYQYGDVKRDKKAIEVLTIITVNKKNEVIHTIFEIKRTDNLIELEIFINGGGGEGDMTLLFNYFDNYTEQEKKIMKKAYLSDEPDLLSATWYHEVKLHDFILENTHE